ncbi:interactor of constitutive active ROPs 2, chloroplastic-like [Aristolochia californica]|uniref:interactor of constitutive active ROPs 2, chloroplastic-like n=1 Tax=Aristolochia californica TaxID=171875 RepID=UPI0035D7E30E
MQTPKSRSGAPEVPQRTSPVTPRTRQSKTTTGSASESPSSGRPVIKTSADRSPKVLERKSPRSPASEKKRPGRIPELENQISKLQEELKKAKDQLSASESWKTRAQEGDDLKKQLAAMAAKLEESQKQLIDLAASEEARLQELRKISQERDKAWESELEALQKQHSMDSAAFSSAMNEISRLKHRLVVAGESEAIHAKQAEMAHLELQAMKQDMAATLSLLNDLKSQIRSCEESEAHANHVVKETLTMLETNNAAMAVLRNEGLKAADSLTSISAELEESRSQVSSLEQIISKMKADKLTVICEISSNSEGGNELQDTVKEAEQLKAELTSVKAEVEQLKTALEATEIKYQEECIKTMMEIQSAHELVEQIKSETNKRHSRVEEELKKANEDIVELKANLMDKETELQGIVAENEGLSLEIEKCLLRERENEQDKELKKLQANVADLKANLLDKETELQNIAEENELLKSDIKKQHLDTEAEAARAAEREALAKLHYVSEEADKSTRGVVRITEQLEAAQAANSEMEAELRRIRIQSEQWRKAAEAAAAVLSGNNGKIMERTGSLDNVEYHEHVGGKLMNSPYFDDLDDDSPKKKNNMLKKIGVLWKKGQK